MLLMRTSSFRIRRAPWTLSSRFIPFSLARVSSKPFSASSKVCCHRKDKRSCCLLKGQRFPPEETYFVNNSYFVPLWFLHFLGLSLRCEDETCSQGRYSPFSDGLLGVPHCIKYVVKEGLHLLKEEGGCADSQLPQHQHLDKTDYHLMTCFVV